MSTLKNVVFAIVITCCGIAGAANPTAVYVEPLDLSELVINSPDSYYGAGRQGFTLTDQERAQLKLGFLKSTQKVFASAEQYTVVDNADEADVVIRARLVELSPMAPKDDFHSRRPNQKFVTRGAGTAKFQFDVIKTGAYEIALEDRFTAGHTWERNDRMNNTRRFKQMLRSASASLLKSVSSYEA